MLATNALRFGCPCPSLFTFLSGILKNESCNVYPGSLFQIVSAIREFLQSNPVGQLTGHDCYECDLVRYLLVPLMVVLSRAILCDSQSPAFFSLTEKLCYWIFKAAQLFIPPRNCPWWDNQPDWRVLV